LEAESNSPQINIGEGAKGCCTCRDPKKVNETCLLASLRLMLLNFAYKRHY
jgi:hypothetical protein